MGEAVQPHSSYHKLQHSTQKYKWDCGIACVKMVLPRKISEMDMQSILANLDIDESVWTIDLCYLLRIFNVKHELYTRSLGVDEGFAMFPFYKKIILKDKKRISKRFNEVTSNDVIVHCKSVTHEKLMSHLSRNGPIIVLVDTSYLCCDLCKSNKMYSELEWLFCARRSYRGHYIVLCGYNTDRQRYYYRDPALSNRICATNFRRLDKARLSYGTDEDVIFVYK